MLVEIARKWFSRKMPRLQSIELNVVVRDAGMVVRWTYRFAGDGWGQLALLDGIGDLDVKLAELASTEVRRLERAWSIVFSGSGAARIVAASADWPESIGCVMVPRNFPAPLYMKTVGGNIPEILVGAELPAGIGAATVSAAGSEQVAAATLVRCPARVVALKATTLRSLDESFGAGSDEDVIQYVVDAISTELSAPVAGMIVLTEPSGSSWLSASAPGVVALPHKVKRPGGGPL